MALGRPVQQNVRPGHRSDFEDTPFEPIENDDAYSDSQDESDNPAALDAKDGQGSSMEESASEDENIGEQLRTVSFGALLEAKDALGRKRKRGPEDGAEQEAKLEGIRARLQEIKSQKSRKRQHQTEDSASRVPRHSQADVAQRNSNLNTSDPNDSDSAPSEEGATSRSRTSKHAPATQSSKHQVTRKRIVVDVPKRTYRDPRFDALHQSTAPPGNAEKAYSFLQDYQKSEVAELKAAIKQSRNDQDRETLKRKLVSMENRLKAKEARDRTQEVLRRHRKEEREKVEQGKKPFFLKKSELKERVLVEKFKGMKSKDREKLMERRRKKEGQKEKKRMPNARRVAG